MNQDGLQDLVDEIRARSGTPGLVVGVACQGATHVAASGTARLDTGAPMTPQTRWIAGSITKVWTASLAMIACEQGVLDLQTPVREYLPTFAVGSPQVTSNVTPWHLLNHSAGWDSGDFFPDLTTDDYLAALRRVGQLHPLGVAASYNNAGWVVLGKVLEAVTGVDFDSQLRDRLIAPLGLGRACLSEDITDDDDHAVGSVPAPDGSWASTPRLLYPQGLKAAGTNLWVSAGDLLRFFQMHLAGGDGILTSEAVDAMQARAVTQFPGDGITTLGAPRAGYGLGWLHDALPDGRLLLQHGGGSIGGVAAGGIVPSLGLAWAAYTNSPLVQPLAEVQNHVLDLPAAVAPPTRLSDPRPMLGRYRRSGFSLDVTRSDEPGLMEIRMSRVEGELLPEPYLPSCVSFRAREVAPNALYVDGAGEPLVEFFDPDHAGRFSAMFMGRRLARRAG
jgi:CubicO group peptidase (beta-lactamase class C family)